MLSVAYHSQQVLSDLAVSLGMQITQPYQWLVINNSPESAGSISLEASCKTTIIRGIEGEGFSEGCNRGLEQLQSSGWKGWVWLLNPDTTLPQQNTFAHLEEQLAQLPPNALVGTAICDRNGLLEQSAGWIDPGLDFRRRRINQELHDDLRGLPINVDWVSGCSLIFKPSAHFVQPRFEASLPLYYEDMDLCLRLAGTGAPILWLPSVRITHQGGKGSEVPSSRRIRLSTCSYIRFLQRHRSGWVLILRTIRLLLNSLIRLPFKPSQSLAAVQGWFEACRKPIA